MTVTKTAIDGVLILEPKIWDDARGYFFESYNAQRFAAEVAPIIGHDIRWVQDNESHSIRGVMRGLHYQRMPWTQAKLVRVVTGKVLDVVVDIRKGSPTYGKHVAVELSGENHRQLFIPRGMAHGFAVLSEEATFQYKCDNFYQPEAEAGILLNDTNLNIDWGIPPADAILSTKDELHPQLCQAPSDFDINDNLYEEE